MGKCFFGDLFFYVVYKGDTIHQLAFFSPHGSRFLYGATIKEGIYTDFIWSVVASIAVVDICFLDYFSRLGAAVSESKQPGFKEGLETRRQNRKSGKEVRSEKTKLQSLISIRAALLASQKKGYPGLKAARDKFALGGYWNLKRAADSNSAKWKSFRENKLDAIFRSKEIIELLSKPKSFYKTHVVGQLWGREKESSNEYGFKSIWEMGSGILL